MYSGTDGIVFYKLVKKDKLKLRGGMEYLSGTLIR